MDLKEAEDMLEYRWTYSNGRSLTLSYGHVDYHGPHILGQWFALDAKSGREIWSGRFRRADTVRGVEQDIIIASETRSDGPWTADYGIYAIDIKTGALLWTNHGDGFLGNLCRWLDHVPLFTNELRDSPECLADGHLLTYRKRVLDIRTGRKLPALQLAPKAAEPTRAELFYHDKSLALENGDTLKAEGHGKDFSIAREDRTGRQRWKFSAGDYAAYAGGDYYSYRLTGRKVLVILGDAPRTVPIDPSKPMFVKPNPANYRLAILDIDSGECRLAPLENAGGKTECRIEAVRDSRLLISSDSILLTEYEIHPI